MTIEEIKKKKEELGYTTEQLSKLSGVPLGTLQKIFAGVTRVPRFETRAAIERVLFPAKPYNFDGLNHESVIVSEAPVPFKNTMGKKQGEYTVDDYRAWPEDERVELIDGTIFVMEAPSFIHQRFLFQFAYAAQNYINSKNGDCIPMVAPVDVRLDCDNKTMIQPDALILCDKSKIRSWGIDGAPDFVLEVLSDSTRKKDLNLKMKKYLNAGVREYWIIDPRERRLYVYNFMDEGIPGVYPLSGEVGVGIYNGELKISLDEFAAMYNDIPEDE